MINAFKNGENWKNFPATATIAEEGQVIRILGGWFGNEVDNCQSWQPTIEKVTRTFMKWSLGHNSMEARRHATQQIAAGMTQFLTDVQEMPESVRKKLESLTRDFIWAGKAVSPVAMDYLYKSKSQGG
ncbi:hypothetical protein HDZ31DRAFT_6113, partial [Schizophyllum fasciatum]